MNTFNLKLANVYNTLIFLGLGKKKFDKVKLHVTAMNTDFQEIGKKETFNATKILQVKHKMSFKI